MRIFSMEELDGNTRIVAPVRDRMSIFQSAGYYGNGPCWVQVVQVMLEEENPALLKEITFNEDRENFVAELGAHKEYAERIIAILEPIFSDDNKLRERLNSYEDEDFEECL